LDKKDLDCKRIQSRKLSVIYFLNKCDFESTIYVYEIFIWKINDFSFSRLSSQLFYRNDKKTYDNYNRDLTRQKILLVLL